MDRNRFLEMCRDVARIKGGIFGKKNVPDKLLVVYNGNEYYPSKYEMSFDEKGKTINTAVIHDLNTNAWYYVPLNLVEEKE